MLDLHMPGMSGLSVLQQLRESGPRLPIVVITAYEVPEVRSYCLSAGASAYLRKPLHDQTLLEAIAKAVA